MPWENYVNDFVIRDTFFNYINKAVHHEVILYFKHTGAHQMARIEV